MKKEEPIKPEYSADLMEELEATPSMVEEEAVIPPEKPKSTAELRIDSIYEEIGQAKKNKTVVEGTDVILDPADRIAYALNARDRANRLAETLRKTGAEFGSAKEASTPEEQKKALQEQVRERMSLERAEIAAKDAENLALTIAGIFGVDESSPAVQEKLKKINADAGERDRQLNEEAKRNAVMQEMKRKEAYDALKVNPAVVDRAVRGADLKSLSDKNVPSPFESMPPQEPTGVHEVTPMQHVEDVDIIGTAENLDELNNELLDVEVGYMDLLEKKNAPNRAERLQELLNKAEELSMRAASAGQQEANKGTPETKKTISLMDFRATKMILRLREQLKEAKGEEDTNIDVARPVRESQIFTESSEAEPTVEESAEETVFESQAQMPTKDLGTEKTRISHAQAAVTENASQEMTAEDMFEEKIGGTESEKTVVTPTIPEASILSNEPTRITAKPERTVVTPPPTMEEPPTEQAA